MVGGLARTVEYKGFRFDIGGHRFFTQAAGGPGPLGGVARKRVHRRAAALPDSTTTASSSTTRFRPADALRGLGRDAVRSHPLELPARPSVAGSGRRELRAVGDEPLRPAAVSRSSSRPTPRRSGAFHAPRSAPSGPRSGSRASRLRARSSRGTALNQRPATIKTLITSSSIRARARADVGGVPRPGHRARRDRVLLHHRVTRLDLVDGRVRAVSATTPDGERRFEAEHVISTDAAPLTGAGASAPVHPTRCRWRPNGLNYRDFLVVAPDSGSGQAVPR